MFIDIASKMLLAIRQCSNWVEVLVLLLQNKPPTHLKLRNGLRIISSQNLLPQVSEIFDRQVYNPIELPIEPNDLVVDIGANVGIFFF